MQFSDLALSQNILQALTDKGYTQPTPIQAQAIPAVLEGRDVMAAAQTGTGKTAGFTLPMLELLSKGDKARANQVRALVLTPTRELADQVWQNVETYSQHLNLSTQVVYGGVKINPQMMKLRRGADILVATPGRLLDLFQQNAIKFDRLELFVLDEADRMLDMGFIHDIKRVIKLLPKNRQNLMFSATFSDEIRELAKGLINDPVEISVAPANSTVKSIEQSVYEVDRSKRTGLLKHLVKTHNWQQVLVFTRTKHGANRLVRDLEKAKIAAAAIHGNKSQNARMKALSGFKEGEVRVLVATDIVARGLDIQELPNVVNFDLPNVYEDYVHRIGRTGRAGATGEAVSFVTHEDADDLFGIERLIQELIPRKIEPGFEPQNPVPESKLDTRPLKKKKPKKPKKPKQVDGEQAATGNQQSKAKPNSSNVAKQKSKPRSQGNRAEGDKSNANKPRRNKPNSGNRKPQNGNNKPSGQGQRSEQGKANNSNRSNNNSRPSNGNRSSNGNNAGANKPKRSSYRNTRG
ncbi:DEAD/DEAH box helicase [Pseudoalteromonas phenolica]|uniref:DEAD/DEAH box helicase n=1 Tax=Pseudoalteromonas phenolica TaxID=161398 RepID=UPI00384AB739